MHRDGVWARQAGRDPSFAHGPVAHVHCLFRGQSGGGGDLFDGHLPVQKGVGGEPDRAHAATAELAGETVSAGEEVVGPDSPSNTLLIGHVHRLVDDAAVCPQQRYYRLYQGLRHRLDELPSERLYWVQIEIVFEYVTSRVGRTPVFRLDFSCSEGE